MSSLAESFAAVWYLMIVNLFEVTVEKKVWMCFLSIEERKNAKNITKEASSDPTAIQRSFVGRAKSDGQYFEYT